MVSTRSGLPANSRANSGSHHTPKLKNRLIFCSWPGPKPGQQGPSPRKGTQESPQISTRKDTPRTARPAPRFRFRPELQRPPAGVRGEPHPPRRDVTPTHNRGTAPCRRTGNSARLHMHPKSNRQIAQRPSPGTPEPTRVLARGCRRLPTRRRPTGNHSPSHTHPCTERRSPLPTPFLFLPSSWVI